MRQSPQAATQQKRKRPEAPGEAANTAGSISAVKTSRAAGFERVKWMGLPWSSAAFAPHGKNKSTAVSSCARNCRQSPSHLPIPKMSVSLCLCSADLIS